jgi:hypothetical protein
VANSVHQDRQGPDWPLGSIVVPTPGTPVSIMSLVDPTNTNAPESPTSTTSNEYAPRAQQIIFQAFKSSATPPTNTTAIYIVRKGAGGGSGNRSDLGSIVAILSPGQTFVLSSAALNRDVFNPYRYFIDADTANDACQVTLLMQ